MLRYVTDVAVDPTVEFDIFPLLDPIPSRDEALFFRIGGGWVTGKYVTVIRLPECVLQMSCSGVADVRQYDLE